MDLSTLLTLLGPLGGAAGLAALWRAFAQNRLDRANAEKAEAETEKVIVETARSLVADVRAEMDLKVTSLEREVGRLRGHLEAAVRERDDLRKIERTLREENAQLRARIEALEARVRALTEALERATAAAPGRPHLAHPARPV